MKLGVDDFSLLQQFYVSVGHVKIPLMPRQEMFVEINCVRPQRAAQTSITAVNGMISVVKLDIGLNLFFLWERNFHLT